MSLEITNYTNILIELNRAVKMHNFYPVGHPNLDQALESCYNSLKKNIAEGGNIKWQVDPKGFFYKKDPLAQGNIEIRGLAKKAFFRRINELTFTERLNISDLRSLLTIMKLEPEEVKARGGVETILAESDVEGILLNEMSYESLKKLKKELEEKREKEKNIHTEKPEETEEGQAEKTLKEEERRKDAGKQETMAELLELLKNETDFLKYNDITVRIREKADLLILKKHFDEIFPAMKLLMEHSAEPSTLPADLKDLARERLGDLLSTELNRYLVIKVGRKNDPEKKTVQQVLLVAGPRVVDMLLDSLVEAPEASTRRNYYDTVLLFGDSIKASVLERLMSEVWYEVRQMVALLGDLRDPETIDQLEIAYRHEDIRVKKEVLKSLVKIPSPRSRELLVRALDEQDTSLKCQAIISMGVTRDVELVDIIGRLALKKGSFYDNWEVKKESIKALGIIGDASAVPYLTKILFKKSWFNKSLNEEIRSLAVGSLGMIDTDESIKAIEKAYNSSEGELHMACKRILEGREKS